METEAIAVVGMQMHAAVVHTRTDILLMQTLDELVAIDPATSPVDHQRARVPAVDRVRLVWSGQADRQISKSFVIGLPEFISSLQVLFDPRQLVNADGSLQIHHIVLEARKYHLVVLITFIRKALPGVLTHAMKSINPKLVGEFLIVGRDHAALAGDHILCK